MKLIGLRLCEHDSNISYFDGNRVRYFKSERMYQKKHHAYRNLYSWRDDFKNVFGDDPDDVDEIAVVIDPWSHKGLSHAPQETYSEFLKVRSSEEFFPAIEYPDFPSKCNVFRVNHHYAHSLSCWPINDKKVDVDIVIDGFGDMDNTWTVFKDGRVFGRGYYSSDGSIGCEMVVAGERLNIEAEVGIDISGKLMGLQSYGKHMEEYAKTLPLSMRYIKEIFDMGRYFSYYQNSLMARITPLNWIRTVHNHIGNVLLDFFENVVDDNDSIITYSGGVAQNVIWNTLLKKRFPNLIIPPHCNDEGLSLGALEYLRIKNNLPKFELEDYPYSQSDVKPDSKPNTETIFKVAKALKDGKVVAWYQGNGEIGPRALGNRSLLINPMIKDARNIINKIKKREPYRPFGSSVLKEYQEDYFDSDIYNPYMLYVANTKVPGLESITHIDGTCRYQTVDVNNGSYYNLLKEFHRQTNCPVLLNTSLNINGKPIISDFNDLEYFNDKVDLIVIGNDIY